MGLQVQYKERINGRTMTYTRRSMALRERDYEPAYLKPKFKTVSRYRALKAFSTAGVCQTIVDSIDGTLDTLESVQLVGERFRVSPEFQYACYSRDTTPLKVISDTVDALYKREQRKVFE